MKEYFLKINDSFEEIVDFIYENMDFECKTECAEYVYVLSKELENIENFDTDQKKIFELIKFYFSNK